ncbi:hypothetical protein [Salibacterium aidingense]|uniref:hypothetical protein n=1 Tax=Salibacterium aidingense TaxID=384933 RepID=UPI000417480B|nr:hypothetical protein [Salibacterium aidingense]
MIYFHQDSDGFGELEWSYEYKKLDDESIEDLSRRPMKHLKGESSSGIRLLQAAVLPIAP